MNKQEQILMITAEESAEVIQEISKIFRFGIDATHKSGVKHREKLEEEVGDLLCMVDLLIEAGIIDNENVEIAMRNKRDKLKVYSTIFNEDVA
jgi:NTP pyrophosphatase (non-canonical NTP hydrolase)